MPTTKQYEQEGVRLIQGDCLDVMPTIEPGSVDLILSDLPYGTTACKWDTVIPFEPLWACFRHVLKPKGAVVLTASQPFTSMLVMSNREWFRYEDIWEKSVGTGYLDANRKPLRCHESVLVFSSGKRTYHPQMRPVRQRTIRRGSSAENYGKHTRITSSNNGTAYPRSVLYFPLDRQQGKKHPNEKPVALFEYLIRTYSNEGETVLDATIGSGTTAVAALNTNRRCIGIERDPGYFATACKRVESARCLTTGATS